MSRETLIAQLRAMDVDETETEDHPVLLNKVSELRRESRELLDGLAREDHRREEDERLERLVGERLAKIEENTRPRAPQYKPRSKMTPAEKSKAMSELEKQYGVEEGHRRYLALAWK
jgi:hypothetical protein